MEIQLRASQSARPDIRLVSPAASQHQTLRLNRLHRRSHRSRRRHRRIIRRLLNLNEQRNETRYRQQLHQRHAIRTGYRRPREL